MITVERRWGVSGTTPTEFQILILESDGNLAEARAAVVLSG